MKTPVLHLLAALTLIVSINPSAIAQGTAFTYQGRLNNGGAPASGVFDLTFTLYNVNSNGVAFGGPLTNSATAVSNGLFTATIDFGPGLFTGGNYWLEIGVRTNGGGAFTTLSPRQPVLPTPYAIMANSASNLLGALSTAQLTGTFPANQLSGTIPSASLSGTYSGPVTFNNGADVFDGTFIGQFIGSSFLGGTFTGQFLGDGSGLVNINPAHIAGSVAYLNSNQVFTAQNIFMQPIGLGLANPVPFYQIDAQAGQSNTRFTSTNNGNGAVMELRNLTTNAYEYIGAINFNNAAGSYAGQIGYIAADPTNVFNDYFEFRVGGNIGLRLQADPRGLGAANVIGGYPYNSISTLGSGGDVIAGGGFGGGYNTIYSNSSGVFIGAGSANSIGPNVNDAVIGGGFGNNIGTGDSVIGGGYGNLIRTNGGGATFIGGGYQNLIDSGYNFEAIIGGGYQNVIGRDTYQSFIGGGYQNYIGGYVGFIGGGYYNTIQSNATWGFIGNGYQSTIQSYATAATIGGGAYHTIHTNAYRATIAGGYINEILIPSIIAKQA